MAHVICKQKLNITFTLGSPYLFDRVTLPLVACVAAGFKGLGFYSEGNYGERNEKHA